MSVACIWHAVGAVSADGDAGRNHTLVIAGAILAKCARVVAVRAARSLGYTVARLALSWLFMAWSAP